MRIQLQVYLLSKFCLLWFLQLCSDLDASLKRFLLSTVAGQGEESILQFAPFQSAVDEGFWHRLSSLKLNRLWTDESPVTIAGFYAPCSNHQVSNHFTLLAESLPPEASEQPFMPVGNRNRCAIPGILINTNTLEGFRAFDKQQLLRASAETIRDCICSGEVEENCTILSRFILVSFADLKKWNFHYWFGFPALTLDPPATVVNLKPATQWFSAEEAKSVTAACNDWRNTVSTTDVPFFLVSISSNSAVTIRHLAEFEACHLDGHKVLIGFYDPCHLPNNPGWPLRNLLWFICRRWSLQKVQFFCYRESHGFVDLELSLVGEALLPNSEELKNHDAVLTAVGWELNSKGLNASRCINLAKTMDPTRLAIEAADLNLKLMRWIRPSLNLNLLSTTRCLLLGAGTLGCQVARMLMAWGVRKITILDGGNVSMSNPLWQSLYTLDDCANGGEFKAVAAVKGLSKIFPAAGEAKSVTMKIPMPGHPVASAEVNSVVENCKNLQNLINSHDAVFLLTDTRESRWLPTLFCANMNKITITAALGFDTFLVMRHGTGPLSTEIGQRLGCYFCEDVSAPCDSITNRRLDQLCTVTRPGLAPIASSLAVRLLVNILHHNLRISIKAEPGSGIGPVPHKISGSISWFFQVTSECHASPRCTACSSTVVSEYHKRGTDFIVEAINYPKYLEDITGLSDLDVDDVEME